MKKLIFGISLLISGILGMVGLILATTLEGEGFGGQGLSNCIIYSGMMPYFLVFCVMSIYGIVIAYKEAYNNKE